MDKTIKQYAQMLAIENQVTTPLQQDQSDLIMWRWQVGIPPLAPHSQYDSLPVLVALNDDYTIGYYSYVSKRWCTDLGTFEATNILFWANLPALPE